MKRLVARPVRMSGTGRRCLKKKSRHWAGILWMIGTDGCFDKNEIDE